MKFGRWLAVLLATVLVCVGCQSAEEWKGYDEEDLGRYLTLGDYRSFSYETSTVSVSDEEVDAVIAECLASLSELTETDKPLADGMTVTLDRYCLIDGVSEPSLSEAGGTYVCGANYADAVIGELLSRMLGMKKGESAELSVTLPAGYRGDGSPSVTAVYRVTVLAVYEKQVLTLTDTVAGMLLPGCESAEIYRETVRNELLAAKQKEADYKRSAELKARLISESELIRCPEEPYTEQYLSYYNVYAGLAEVASQSLEEYLATMQMTEEEFEEQLNARTEAAVKERLVLYLVVKEENITYTDEQLAQYAEAMAVSSGGVFGNGDEYMDYYGKDRVAEDYLWEQVMAILLSVASPDA